MSSIGVITTLIAMWTVPAIATFGLATLLRAVNRTGVPADGSDDDQRPA